MSDEAQTLYRWGLALCCFGGAWWITKVSGGVSDDQKSVCNEGDVRNVVASNDRVRVLSDRGLASGANPMKEQDEHRGQVIDFLAARDRIALRRWAVAHGFARLPVRPR